MSLRTSNGSDMIVNYQDVAYFSVAGDLAERAVELELVDAREEVHGVGRAGGHVVLRAGVELVLGALATTESGRSI